MGVYIGLRVRYTAHGTYPKYSSTTAAKNLGDDRWVGAVEAEKRKRIPQLNSNRCSR